MKRTILALILALPMSIIFGVKLIKVVEANPMVSGSPTEPIKDPPVIIINTPINTTYFQNVIRIKITVIQRDSWVTNQSDPTVWVIGPTTLRLAICELNGQSFTLRNGTRAQIGGNNSAVCYYLPKDAQFSAILNVSNGQHKQRFNVHAIAQYYPIPDFPFPSKYNIDTSQSVTFLVQTSSDTVWSSTIDFVETPSVPFPPNASILSTIAELFPVVLLAAASVAVAVAVAAGLFLYLRRRKPSEWDETE